MFGNLKSKNNIKSNFKNSEVMIHAFHRSPGASTSLTKVNEGDRLVRCRVCGFICDRERDLKLPDGSYAGLGVVYSAQQTAAVSKGDAKTPAAGVVSGTPDRYYTRTIAGGCPCCGSYLYDTVPAAIPPLQ